MEHLVVARNLRKRYSNGQLEVEALRGIDLEIGPGEFTAIVGPSGSGKTTLLNLIGALDTPTSGELRVMGKELTRMSRRARADLRLHTLGFVFQAYNLVPVLTAYENVELPLVLLGRKRDASTRAAVMSILSEVGLEGLETRLPSDLSGGQQQRVAIARALVKQPALVLADEPTANLDSDNARAILDLMSHLNSVKGVTFLFSTHDQLVMEYARRIVSLRDGKIVNDERR